MARDLITDIRRVDRALAQNHKRTSDTVAESGTTLTVIRGISDILTAKIIGHTGDPHPIPTSGHYASYTGTAPIEASSGDVKRHRLSRAGNRQLNHALHIAARVQTMHPGPGQDYYRRKITEGHSRSEALRSLKRQLTKAVYRHPTADHHRAGLPAAA
jgi:transposase